MVIFLILLFLSYFVPLIKIFYPMPIHLWIPPILLYVFLGDIFFDAVLVLSNNWRKVWMVSWRITNTEKSEYGANIIYLRNASITRFQVYFLVPPIDVSYKRFYSRVLQAFLLVENYNYHMDQIVYKTKLILLSSQLFHIALRFIALCPVLSYFFFLFCTVTFKKMLNKNFVQRRE